jgi:hypothetical protein
LINAKSAFPIIPIETAVGIRQPIDAKPPLQVSLSLLVLMSTVHNYRLQFLLRLLLLQVPQFPHFRLIVQFTVNPVIPVRSIQLIDRAVGVILLHNVFIMKERPFHVIRFRFITTTMRNVALEFQHRLQLLGRDITPMLRIVIR